MLRHFARQAVRPISQFQAGSRRHKTYATNSEEEGSQSGRFEKCINQVNLLGRVGRDAEVRGTEEHPVVVFSLATSSVFTKADGQTVSRVDWHRVSVFKPGLREKVAAYLKKGDRVYVTGVIRYDEIAGGQEKTIRTTNILANDLLNLTKRYLAEEDDQQQTVNRGF